MQAKKLKAFTLIGATSALVVSCAIAFSTQSKAVYNIANADHTLSLSASNFASLSTTASDGTFDSLTPSENTLTWEYHNAKKDGNNLVLVKSVLGNVTFEDNYLGNTNPITSTSNITVNFSGAKYVRVYAGLNPDDDSTFYYVALLDSSASVFSTTAANNYYYYRFVNDDHENDDCVISSISITYSCDVEDRTDKVEEQAQKSDILSTVVTGQAAPDHNTEILFDSNYSTQSNQNNYKSGRCILNLITQI